MRRQVNWLVLAVTSLVVVAFVLPLGLLVQRQAQDRAQVGAEQRAQSVAAALAVAVSSSDGMLSPGVAESALVAEAIVILPDGTSTGDGPVFPALVSTVMTGRSASETSPSGDWAIGLPVATSAGMVAVVAVAKADEMTAGVWRATGLLAGLAFVLIAGSVLLADRLGRSLVHPVTEVASVANRLAEGNLAARASVDGPPEIRSVALALNGLATRLGDIIDGEREALADLSHRLRTPLTALRLQAERADTEQGRNGLIEHVERTEDAVDQLIQEVRDRGPSGRGAGPVDLVEVVRQRLAFWAVLAEDQGRDVVSSLPVGPVMLDTPPSEAAATLDALVGNVFAHTPPGTAFSVSVRLDGTTPLLEVADAGPGFGEGRAVERGRSGAGSTGLGLDIARSLSETLGGTLEMGEGPAGGALVVARLGV